MKTALVCGSIGIVLLGCATGTYFPNIPSARQADGVRVAREALVETFRDASLFAKWPRTIVYVRFGNRPAPQETLETVPMPPNMVLQPDPREQPRDGQCLQINVSLDPIGRTASVSAIWGHDHLSSVSLDHSGCNLEYRHGEVSWDLVQRTCWIE